MLGRWGPQARQAQEARQHIPLGVQQNPPGAVAPENVMADLQQDAAHHQRAREVGDHGDAGMPVTRAILREELVPIREALRTIQDGMGIVNRFAAGHAIRGHRIAPATAPVMVEPPVNVNAPRSEF